MRLRMNFTSGGPSTFARSGTASNKGARREAVSNSLWRTSRTRRKLSRPAKNQLPNSTGSQPFWAIGSSVTTRPKVALARAEIIWAVGIGMLRRSAAKRSTYPIQCWLSRGGNGQPPFTQAQLKARITASNHQSATRRRSGCLTKSRPRTADPAKLASPTTSRKASLEIAKASIIPRLLVTVN